MVSVRQRVCPLIVHVPCLSCETTMECSVPSGRKCCDQCASSVTTLPMICARISRAERRWYGSAAWAPTPVSTRARARPVTRASGGGSVVACRLSSAMRYPLRGGMQCDTGGAGREASGPDRQPAGCPLRRTSFRRRHREIVEVHVAIGLGPEADAPGHGRGQRVLQVALAVEVAFHSGARDADLELVPLMARGRGVPDPL